jgi:hypothetical protein
MSYPPRIAVAARTSLDRLAEWHDLWLKVGGPTRNVPLAAFMRDPEILVSPLPRQAPQCHNGHPDGLD